MPSENWVVGNLEYALQTWNEKMTEIWTLISQAPEEFRGGTIWRIVVNINGGIKAIGYALLVLFFLVGVVKTCGSLNEIKRPEQALRLFIRFAAAKGVVSYGLELMTSVFKIIQGVINSIVRAAGIVNNSDQLLPQEIIKAIEKCLNKKAVLDLLPLQPGDVIQTWADTASIQRDIGFCPRTDIQSGVSSFVKWYREFYGC